MDPRTREALLRQAGIRTFDRPIRAMSAGELIAHFGARDSGRVVAARLIKNIVFEVWQRIGAGLEPEVRGNVRTFWYRYVKPVWMRIPPERRQRKAPARATSRLLAELIEAKRLFDYADFGFTDENWRNRGIGIARPQVLVAAEKAGQIRLLLRLHKRLGVSFLALGGMPSACTSEFTARQVRRAMAQSGFTRRKTVHVLALVDHDPAGELIARTFSAQLAAFDIGRMRLHLVVRPAWFTAAQRRESRLPLRPGAAGRRWLAGGGGVDGGPWTLSVDSLPFEVLEARTRALIRKVAPRPVARDRMRVPVDDPRWQRALRGPGGAARVLVVRPDELGEEAMAMMAEGYRLVVVQEGRIVGLLARGDVRGGPR